MTTRVDVEQIETTRGEKLLTVVLAVFVLTGLLWTYFNIDVERHERVDYYTCYDCPEVAYESPAAKKLVSAADYSALGAEVRAREKASQAASLVADRRVTLVDRREAYRTALDAGERDAALERGYRTAQRRYTTAQTDRRRAGELNATAKRAAAAPHRRLKAAEQRRQARDDAQARHDGRVSVARRLALVLGALAAAYALLATLRRRGSRYMLTAMAAVGAVAALTLVMAIDYLTDYVEITDQGVLALSAGGAVLTLVAFWWLQRYLRRRLPERRVRKGECAFCGYPVHGAHCEGCGREAVSVCPACAAPRRVATAHCAACGAE